MQIKKRTAVIALAVALVAVITVLQVVLPNGVLPRIGRFVPVTGVEAPAYVRFGSSAIVGSVFPPNATNRNISWSLVDVYARDAGATLVGGTLHTHGATFPITIRATVVNGRGPGRHFTEDFTVNVVVEVGDVIPFGRYDWIVLDIEDGYAFLLSENILSTRSNRSHRPPQLAPSWSYVWAEAGVRTYLNEEFYNRFSESERVRIRPTEITPPDDYPFEWFTGLVGSGGYVTTDKIFLLSIEEVLHYFGDSGQLYPRAYTYTGWHYWGHNLEWRSRPGRISDQYDEARIATREDGTPYIWWLRSLGIHREQAAVVYANGVLSVYGNAVNYQDARDLASGNTGVSTSYRPLGVRPALWLNISDHPAQSAP